MAILGDLVAPLSAFFLLVVPAGIILFSTGFRAERGGGNMVYSYSRHPDGTSLFDRFSTLRVPCQGSN